MKLEYEVVLPFGRLARRMFLWALIGAVAAGGPRFVLHLVGSPDRVNVFTLWRYITPEKVDRALGAMFHPAAIGTLVIVALLVPGWYYLALSAYRARPGADTPGKES